MLQALRHRIFCLAFLDIQLHSLPPHHQCYIPVNANITSILVSIGPITTLIWRRGLGSVKRPSFHGQDIVGSRSSAEIEVFSDVEKWSFGTSIKNMGLLVTKFDFFNKLIPLIQIFQTWLWALRDRVSFTWGGSSCEKWYSKGFKGLLVVSMTVD